VNDDIIDVRPVGERSDTLKALGWVSYILLLIVAIAAVVPGGQFSPPLMLVALVIDIVKRSDAESTWQASHFTWRIRTVIWAGVLYVVTVPLWFLFIIPGWIAWSLISLWFLYRVVLGMVEMNKCRPIRGGVLQ